MHDIKELLRNSDGRGIAVRVVIPVCIYYESKDGYSESECEDTNLGGMLTLDNIDDSYKLDICEDSYGYIVNIPVGTKCIIKRGPNPNYDCTVSYNFIKADLSFEEDEYTIDDYFEPEE